MDIFLLEAATVSSSSPPELVTCLTSKDRLLPAKIAMRPLFLPDIHSRYRPDEFILSSGSRRLNSVVFSNW